VRLRISHQIAYRYAAPAARVIENLRLTPRGHDGQYIVNWRIDIDRDCRLEPLADPLGNIAHSFSLEGPIDGLLIAAGGEVETQDMQGVVRGQFEPLPATVFTRETPLTMPDAGLRAHAMAARAASDGTALDFLHGLMHATHERLALDPGIAPSGAPASEVLAAGHGVCHDFAHVFVGAARHAGVPARYVSGYVYREDSPDLPALHAWSEALVEGLGWVGFDATEAVCPTECYVRLAVGLDNLGAAPMRGFRYGGTGESLAIAATAGPAGRR
jgi:transglutaminase-like putative cysteine protease